MGQLKGTETPEQVADALLKRVGALDPVSLRGLIADAIMVDREARETQRRPTGLPFNWVSDDDAVEALETILYTAVDVDIDYACERQDLLDVIAHRAHLNKQVTDAQATSTATLLAKRLVDCKLRGVMAWVVGDHNMANPYDVDRDNESWVAWTEGWIMADRADMSSGNAPKRKR